MTIGIFFFLALSSAQASFFDQREVFVSGQDGYHTYRIPALLRTKTGDLLAFAEGRKNSSSDTGDIDLVIRGSTDNGETWGPLQVVWSDGENTCGNPAPVLDADTGAIRLLSTWNLGSDSESAIVNGTSTDTRRVYLLHSSDDGLTWSEPEEITAVAKQTDWTWYATGPGAGIQLIRGAQAGRMIVGCDHKVAVTNTYGSHVLYSDDAGVTWQIGAVAGATATVSPNENLAVELVAPAGDGGSRVFINARDHQSPHARATTYSDDGGSSYNPAFCPMRPSSPLRWCRAGWPVSAPATPGTRATSSFFPVPRARPATAYPSGHPGMKQPVGPSPRWYMKDPPPIPTWPD